MEESSTKSLNNNGDKNVRNSDGTLASQFMSSAEQMREKLGPALCLAKWQQTSLHLTTGHTNSCYHPPLHRIDVDDLAHNPSALHNTGHKKIQRARMLRGEKPEECSYCWRAEATGNLSDRHYRSGEPWAAETFTDILVHDPLTWNVNPAYVEVNFSNVCNLRCSYCSPQFSSTWAQELTKHGAYPTSTRHNDPSHFVGERHVIPNRDANPYLDAFWQWWPNLYPQLKHFRMTGGEPTMDKNTYRVFDYVLANPKSDLHLNTTSNFSQEAIVFDKYLGYVKRLCEGENIEHFMQFVSLDTWGEQAEYIRHGMNFDLVKANVERFLTEVPYRNSLTFIITVSNLAIPGVRKLFEWILELRQTYSVTYQRVWFDTPLLRQPNWQSPIGMPDAFRWKLQETIDWMSTQPETENNRFNGFKDYEIQRLQRIADQMKSQASNYSPLWKSDFYKFFNEHDKRRNTNFLKTFPELNEWWNECKYWSDYGQ
jgi:organic radical activating enzyme